MKRVAIYINRFAIKHFGHDSVIEHCKKKL